MGIYISKDMTLGWLFQFSIYYSNGYPAVEMLTLEMLIERQELSLEDGDPSW